MVVGYSIVGEFWTHTSYTRGLHPKLCLIPDNYSFIIIEYSQLYCYMNYA